VWDVPWPQLSGCVVLLLCGAVQIPSDKVPFNQLPDMKAFEITEAGKEALRSGKYKMVRGAALQRSMQVHQAIITHEHMSVYLRMQLLRTVDAVGVVLSSFATCACGHGCDGAPLAVNQYRS
jgi:hypothetical protein